MRPLKFLVSCVLVCGFAAESEAADLSADFNRLILKGSPELPKEPGDTAIESMVAGDFDCDGRDDLAVGDPRGSRTGNFQFEHGSVSVTFGDPLAGLRVGGQVLNQDTASVIGTAEDGDRFGEALAADDFDADGCSDLAIGVPGENDANAGTTDSGGANVLLGGPDGLSGTNDVFVPNSGAAPAGHTSNHFKGEALVSLHWTAADLRPFLAVSAVGHSPGTAVSAGGVLVRRSNPGAASPLGSNASFEERALYPSEGTSAADAFGRALAAGDFNNDGFDDLVSYSREIGGCPFPNSLCNDARGVLWIAYGAAAANAILREKITQDSPGIPGIAENFDQFGRVLATGDFNGDGRDDLAVGTPDEDLNDIQDAGTVTILYGASNGLLAGASSSIAFSQGNFSALVSETGDGFGQSLSSGDYNRDGFDDLAIGTPREDVGGLVDSGSSLVVYGSPSGIDVATFKVFNLNTPGIVGSAVAGVEFGRTLASGDFNDDKVDDLAVGIFQIDDGVAANLGGISLVFSSGDTLTTIQSISPSPAIAGRPYTVNVTSRRQNTGGVALGRGAVNVSVNAGGGSCIATLNSVGIGSCQITTATPGIRTVNASFPGVIGYRPSDATPSSITVAALPQNIFSNSFE